MVILIFVHSEAEGVRRVFSAIAACEPFDICMDPHSLFRVELIYFTNHNIPLPRTIVVFCSASSIAV